MSQTYDDKVGLSSCRSSVIQWCFPASSDTETETENGSILSLEPSPQTTTTLDKRSHINTLQQLPLFNKQLK